MSSYPVVIISPLVPKPEPTSAGERLVRELYFSLVKNGHKPIVIAPTPTRSLDCQYDVNYHFVPVNRNNLLLRIRDRVGTWTPNYEFLLAIKSDKRARYLIRNASIIDLQWSTNILLGSSIKKMNPSAKLIGTFHDINSQRLVRRATEEEQKIKSLIWSAQAKISKHLDRATAKYLQTAVVLSEKDRNLLSYKRCDRDKIETVLPPVYLNTNLPEVRRPSKKEIIFVGTMYRWENEDAVRWFVKKVLPLVWAKDPEINFKVIGSSPSKTLVDSIAAPRVEFMGFVEDLEPTYSKATLVVAPIRLGSGVKFKTLDAILRGVPVVSTTAGAEGIANIEWITEIANSPEKFAEAILAIVENPERYSEKVCCARNEASSTYSQEKYLCKVNEIYGAENVF